MKYRWKYATRSDYTIDYNESNLNDFKVYKGREDISDTSACISNNFTADLVKEVINLRESLECEKTINFNRLQEIQDLKSRLNDSESSSQDNKIVAFLKTIGIVIDSDGVVRIPSLARDEDEVEDEDKYW